MTTVGELVHHALTLQRVAKCEHVWSVHEEQPKVVGKDPEEKCERCGVIATAAGKISLARMAKRFK